MVVAAGSTVTVDVTVGGSNLAPGSIAGTVTDATSPLGGTWVTVVTSTGMATRAAITDGSGHYTVADLAPGNYKLIVVDPTGEHRWEWYDGATGWADASVVTVPAGATVQADAVLDPAP